MEKPKHRTARGHAIRVAVTIVALLAGVDRGTADAAVIFVTSLAQKVSASGGCSLQEAILSANADSNLISLPTTFFSTECVPGNGADVIVLPTGALLRMSAVQDDALSVFGLAATPLITSNITIEGHGALLEWVGIKNARAFSIGSTAFVTIRNVHIRGFRAKGGNGGGAGGGGGLGAGGAIFLKGGGQLTIEGTTFERNGAIGGDGGGAPKTPGYGGKGGGGGLGGDGGEPIAGGGGGGGSRGNGGAGSVILCTEVFCYFGAGGGGGGTLTNGGNANTGGGAGGQACGGAGGNLLSGNSVADGHDATCDGGGGGGGATVEDSEFEQHGDGGNGKYGGGGGGGGSSALVLARLEAGGHGGFGGGGGGGEHAGGNGGFGGGGGSGGGGFFGGGPGEGGLFGGKGSGGPGGGGGLGGAIFNEGGTVVIKNSTFTGNYAVRGNGGFGGQNGHDAGGAIFSLNGSTVILSSTIYGNETTGALGGVVVMQQFDFSDTPEMSFRIYNSIVAKNGAFDIDGNLINGADGCAVYAGTEAVVDGAANVIETSFGCLGIVSNLDPLAGPLRIESPGITPTLAISSTSSAFDAGDPNAWPPHTALLSDQRGVDRPQGPAMDVGAYEFCLGDPNSASPCKELVIKPGEDKFDLVMGSSLPVGGTVLPGIGTTPINTDTVAVITAVPNAGFAFQSWTGAVADPTAPTTTVLMTESRTITVNFVPWTANLAGKGVPGPNPKSRSTQGTVLAQPRAELTWMAAPVPVAVYQILRAPSSGGMPVPVGTTTGLSFVDQSGLQNSTLYSYIVEALDAQGLVVGRSNVALVTVPNPK